MKKGKCNSCGRVKELRYKNQCARCYYQENRTRFLVRANEQQQRNRKERGAEWRRMCEKLRALLLKSGNPAAHSLHFSFDEATRLYNATVAVPLHRQSIVWAVSKEGAAYGLYGAPGGITCRR